MMTLNKLNKFIKLNSYKNKYNTNSNAKPNNYRHFIVHIL